MARVVRVLANAHEPERNRLSSLIIELVPQAALSSARYNALVDLCTRAYDEPFDELMASFEQATHVVATVGERVVSHALWVPRLLYTPSRVLRTAYVEAVATEPEVQGRGYASATLRALTDALAQQQALYDVGVLSPSDAAFYTRLGWEMWRGPLSVRLPEGDVRTPDDEVMIFRLAGSKDLGLTQSLTAAWREGDIW